MDIALIPSHVLVAFIEAARPYALDEVLPLLETLVDQVLAASRDLPPDQCRVSKQLLVDTYTGFLLAHDHTALRAFAAQIHLHLHEDDIALAQQRLRRAYRVAWCRRAVLAAPVTARMQEAYQLLLMASLALVDGDLPAFCGVLSPEAALHQYTHLYHALTYATTSHSVRLPRLGTPHQIRVLLALAQAEPVLPEAFTDWV